MLPEMCPFLELAHTLEIIETKLSFTFSSFYYRDTEVQVNEVTFPKSYGCQFFFS